MNRFGKSVVFGGIIALWITCFAFAFNVFSALVSHGDVVAAAGQSLLCGFVLWFIFGYGYYELNGWVEERNKPRNLDDELNSAHGVQNFDETRSIDQHTPATHQPNDN